MAIPDYQSIMLPLLRFAGDDAVHRFREAIEHLAQHFELSDKERRELLPSGKQPTFDNRVGWARTYMTKAGLLASPKRGQFRITELGKKVLDKQPAALNVAYLEQFPEFMAFRNLRHDKKDVAAPASPALQPEDSTPEETLESAFQSLRAELANDVLAAVRNCTPGFFERLVVDLVVRMGYGGSRKEAGQAIGGSGDGGIDGIIKEDRLGLDIIYIQAKRWEAVIGRPEIQKFAGALQGQRARKGIFITTSSFSREARDFAGSIETKIILIDGETLVEYMIENNVGVSVEATYELKHIDSDYFVED